MRRLMFACTILLLSMAVCAVAQDAGTAEAKPSVSIEESLYSLYQKNATADITVAMPSPIPGAVLTVALVKEGADTPVAVKTIKPPFASPLTVSFDMAKCAKGSYYLQAELMKGKELVVSEISRPLPYNPNPAVGFNKDGFLVVGGKPFFPVGIYTLQDKDKNHDAVLADGRKAGFNTTVFYAYTMSTVKPLLDAAQRNGIKAFVYPTIPFSVRKDPLTDLQAVEDVQARVEHPALLGWYVVDEPEGIGKAAAEKVRSLYQLIKQTDTEHPCSLVIMSPDAAKKYGMCADVIWTDPYPIPGSPANRVADVVQGCVDAMRHGKPVWAVPQAFDWSVWKTGKVDKEHRPTDAEERCMTYMALVHGAKGIIYWAHTGSRYYIEDYPEHWSYMKKLAGELRDLSPVLLTPNAKRQAEVSPTKTPIETMVKEVAGAVYVFAVNREPIAFESSFRMAGIANGQVEVLYEDRKISASSGAWSDSFKPLEVHVYKLHVR